MKIRVSADVWLAVFFLVVALLTVFVWIPMDTGTGLVETVRRRLVIGDALGPTLAGAFVILGAILVLLRPERQIAFDWRYAAWTASLLALFALSLFLMRHAGSLAASAFGMDYRPLRATPPWSYVGFLLGGTAMVGGLSALAMRRISWQDFAVGLVSSLAIALLYDLPFDDLILPPNGDY